MEIFKPKGNPAIRKPTDNNQLNGQVYNPPRFSQFGGGADGTSIKSRMTKNKMTLEKPGGTRRVV